MRCLPCSENKGDDPMISGGEGFVATEKLTITDFSAFTKAPYVEHVMC